MGTERPPKLDTTHTRPPAPRTPRRRFIGFLPKAQNAKLAAAAIHPSPPAHMAARDQRRRSPAESDAQLNFVSVDERPLPESKKSKKRKKAH